MNKRIIFLDLDETLIDTSNRHYHVYLDILKALNLGNPLDKEEFWKLKRKGIPTIEILNETDHTILKEFLKLWINNIEKKEYLSWDKVFSETPCLLSELDKENLILLTMRNNRENLLWELKKLGFDDSFKAVLSCSPLKNKDKTGPILKYIQDENLSLDKNSVIMGDSEIDIITGKKLNITTMAVSYGIRSEEILKFLHPDYCLKDMNEIIETLKKL